MCIKLSPVGVIRPKGRGRPGRAEQCEKGDQLKLLSGDEKARSRNGPFVLQDSGWAAVVLDA